MSIFDSGFWARHFRQVFLVQVRAFEKSVSQRLVPAFDGIDEEADRVADEEYERLARLPGDDSFDMGDAAETAQAAGLAHYEQLADVRQGLLNLCAAALFHMLEQQLLTYHRRQVLRPEEEDDELLFSRKVILARFKEGGVDIESLEPWRRILELEALANTVKHGSGRSAKRLGILRPDLFVPPLMREDDAWHDDPLSDVQTPLTGDDVYVTLTDFHAFADAVADFWNELADAITNAR